MDRPFPSESGHQRCAGCMECDAYRRSDSGNKNKRFWRCCNCGYALNNDAINADCSFCFLGSSGIGTYGEHWTTHDEFNLGWNQEPVADNLDAASHVICRHEPLHTADTGLFPSHQDDLASAAEQNVLALEHFEATSDPCATFDYDPSFAHSGTTTLTSCGHNGLNVCNTSEFDLAFQKPYSENSMAAKDNDVVYVAQSQPSISNLGKFSANVKPRYAEPCVNLDSGYGTLSDGFSTMSKPLQAERDQSSRVSRTDSLSNTHSDRATCGPTKIEQPRLACPFYKRDPMRCKRNACAGDSYVATGRLLEHLYRAHLYFQCLRCGKTFLGERGERALERHRSAQNCEEQWLHAPWGFNYTTWKKIQSRKGIKGKSREERWRSIYMALFPDTLVRCVPSPHVDCRVATSQDLIHRGNEQELEDISSELLRLLPNRIASSMQNTVNDDTTLAYWKRFTSHHLTAVVQQILREIATMPSALPAGVASIR